MNEKKIVAVKMELQDLLLDWGLNSIEHFLLSTNFSLSDGLYSWCAEFKSWMTE